MRTEQYEVFKGSLKGSRLITPEDSFLVDLSLSSTKDSGSEVWTRKGSSMPSRIFTFISRPESWSLSLSSRGVRVLNSSYWAFTLLSCITFFVSPWYWCLAFLIPALITCHMRVSRTILKRHFNYQNGVSTNGT